MISEPARSEMLTAAGLASERSESANSFLREVEFHIRDVQAEYAGNQQEIVRLLAITSRACQELTSGLESLNRVSDRVLFDSLSSDDLAALPELSERLERLQHGCDSTAAWLRTNSDRPYIETTGAMATLVRRLLPVFDKYYTKRRAGRGARLVGDRFDFLQASLREAGIEEPPGFDQLHQGYVVPAMRLLNRLTRDRVSSTVVGGENS